MADELGTAVLRLELDTSGLKEGLTKAKQQIEQELGTATTTATAGAKRIRQAPPSTRITPKGGARESTDAVEKANQRIIGIQNRLNVLEAKGVDIGQARARLSQAITANNQRNFGTVRQVTTQLSNTLRIEEGRLRVSALQTAQLKRQEAAEKAAARTSAQRPQKPTGVGFATTPEQILASRGGTQRGAAENLSAREAAGDKLIQLRNRLNILEAKGVDISSQRATLERAVTAANSQQLGTAKQITQSLARQVSIDENTLRVANLRAAADKRRLAELKAAERRTQTPPTAPGAARTPPAPGASAAFTRASQAAEAAERKLAAQRDRAAKATQRAEASERKRQFQLRKDVTANALIGVGFPLLFGQGVGAAAGGGVGGALGALGGGTFGFAGSIAGTALGAAFDAALQKAQTLAEGLENPIKNFGALQEAALLSSRSLERQAEALIASGRSGEAYALIQEDLAQTFGSATAASEYRDAVDQLNREWSKATTTLASFTAGPLAEFLKKLRLATGGTPVTSEERAIRSDQQVGLAKALIAAGSFIAPIGGTAALTGVGTAPGLLTLGVGAGLIGAGSRLAGDIDDPKTYQEIEASIAGAVAAATRLREEREKDLKIQELSLNATVESTRGNNLTTLELQKQRLEREKIRELEVSADAPEAEQDRIKAQFNEQIAVTNEQILQAQQKIALESFKEFQTREQIIRSVRNTLQLLGTEQGQYRDTLGTIQQISDTIDAARRKEADIGFQIDQARVGGRDEEAARLVDQQLTASFETRQRFIEGARALKEAGESVRENLTNATQNLQNLKLSNLRFLSPGEQRETLNQLQRDFVAATRERGFTPRITGTRDQVIREKQAFVDFTRQETQLTKAIDQGNRALIEINTRLSTEFESLTSVIPNLTEATASLAAKDWNVSINVVNNADGSRTVEAINGLSS